MSGMNVESIQLCWQPWLLFEIGRASSVSLSWINWHFSLSVFPFVRLRHSLFPTFSPPSQIEEGIRRKKNDFSNLRRKEENPPVSALDRLTMQRPLLSSSSFFSSFVRFPTRRVKVRASIVLSLLGVPGLFIVGFDLWADTWKPTRSLISTRANEFHSRQRTRRSSRSERGRSVELHPRSLHRSRLLQVKHRARFSKPSAPFKGSRETTFASTVPTNATKGFVRARREDF